MGSSSEKMSSPSSTTTTVFPTLTPFSRVASISDSLREKQVVALHGKDKINSPTPADIFSFWVCTVEERKRFTPTTTSSNSENNNKELEKSTFKIHFDFLEVDKIKTST